MEISKALNAASPYANPNSSAERSAAVPKGSAGRERESPPDESTRVQLSAAGQAKSAGAPEETTRRLQDNNNPEAAADANAAAREQVQQGFSFNGVAAYSRIFSS